MFSPSVYIMYAFVVTVLALFLLDGWVDMRGQLSRGVLSRRHSIGWFGARVAATAFIIWMTVMMP